MRYENIIPQTVKVVIAGRTVFKIYRIEEENFEEAVNLRSGKNINLNYSCNDVAWSNLVGFITTFENVFCIEKRNSLLRRFL